MPDNVQTQGIEFEIKSNVNKARKDLDSLAGSLQKIKSATSGGLGLSAVLSELKEAGAAVQNLDFSNLDGLTKSMSGISRAFGKISTVGVWLQNISEIDFSNLRDAANAFQAMGTGMALSGGLGGNIAQNAQSSPFQVSEGSATMEMESVTGSVESVSEAFEQEAQSANEASRAVDNATKSHSGLKKALSGLGSGIKDVTRWVGGKAWQGLTKPFRSFGNTIKNAGSKLSNFASSLKRIAMYRAVRGAISAMTQGLKEGVQNLYQYSVLMGTSFAGSMDTLATNALYLKNSLGAMAAPLINALAPAIDFITDKIVALFNLIGQLFAKLSGASTFTAAKKNFTSYADAVESGAGSAQKALKDFTLGIDELNVINDNAGSGGGGGAGGALDYSNMFEEIEIDSSISEFADKLMDAFKNQRWEDLGRTIGDGLNKAVNEIPFAKIGQKVGSVLNGAVQTAYFALDETNFTAIGEGIAEFFNNALEEIDFDFVGRLIVKPFTSLGDLIIGTVRKLNWKSVGSSLSDGLRGALNEITSFFTKYNWSEVGNDLWRAFKDLVTSVDWPGIAESLFTALGSAVGALSAMVGVIVSDLVNSIGDYFTKYISGAESWEEVAAGILQGIADGFMAIGNWVKEHIFQPFINGFKQAFGIHSPASTMNEPGRMVSEGILEGILAPFKSIKNWVSEHIFTPLKNAIQNGGKVVADFAVGVANTASEWWDNVKSWWSGKVGEVEKFTTSVTNNASKWWSDTIKWWRDETKNETLKLPFGVEIADVIDTAIVVVDTINGVLKTTPFSFLSGAFDGLGDTLREAKSKLTEEDKSLEVNIQNAEGAYKAWYNKNQANINASAAFKLKMQAEADAWKKIHDAGQRALNNDPLKLSVKAPVFSYGERNGDYTPVNNRWVQFNARGGILNSATLLGFTGNTAHIAGEAGNEAILPLDQHTGWMDEIASRVVAAQNEPSGPALTSRLDEVIAFLSEIAMDTKREADKPTPSVRIGNREIFDAYETQKRANGYSFTTA